ncbi:MAG TPA: hypothetical protein PKD09_09185 [Aggregatilinea sp.]|uniref:Gp37-like protein n=1 Tax=Aggregatilinea sp. TaxID=2806333 RepID=UPI002C540FAB|nr:hypothetical protein [Aggregatilinea sp.]HML21809.1 hypothetical protein [Aggregatilinea sp.]
MQASYTINVLDSFGAVVATLDTARASSLRYERTLNDVSTAQFTLALNDPATALLGKHTWFEVFRHRTPAERQREGTFMVAVLDQFRDEDGQDWLIVSGVSLEFLLLQRVLDVRNDPLVAGGWSTKLLKRDVLMAQLVHEQAGPGAFQHGITPSQQVPGLTVEDSGGVGDPIPFRRAWDGLLSILTDLAAGDAMDFEITRTIGVNMLFRARQIGEDKTKAANYPLRPFVVLSPELGRLAEPRLLRDWREEKTVVYLMGKGAGDNREFYGSMAANAQETPYSYAATVEDLRQADDATEYITQAQEALAKNRAKVEFSCTVAQAEDLYGVVWDLGDVVTVRWMKNERDMRITGVTVDVSDETETVTPKLRGRYEQNAG